MNPLQNSFSFLIDSVFELYMVLVLLRFLFQLFKVNIRNPLIDPIVKLTQPPLAWMRRFVPGLFGLDLSAIVFLILLGMTKILLLASINGATVGLLTLLLASVAQVISMTLMVFTVALIAQAVLSWFAGSAQHPVTDLLRALTQPILRPIQRILPAASGVDFSPIVALLAISFLRRLLIDPLVHSLSGLI
ncbi:MAG: YggT family protein [Saprospiraceae bacterium]|jgi:YggT family protein